MNIKNSKNRITCVFFSSSYPYETTLKSEFEVLSMNFDKTYYLPSTIKVGTAQLPQNVILKKSLTELDQKNMFSAFFHSFRLIVQILLPVLFSRDIIFYLKGLKTYMNILLKNIYKAKRIEQFVKESNLQNAIFYDYWFEDSTLALAILKKRGVINHAFCRIHGFDLYDERWKQGRVPFRAFKMKYLDKVFPISDFGLDYLKNKIHPKYHHKLVRHYLGVKKPIEKTKRKTEGKYLVVSAARTISLKQIHKIPEILSHLSLPIHWVHFGDGPALEKAKNQAQEVPSNITYEFKGQVPNEEVLKFYSANEVDLFISTSQSEGLPISMMEVISYGIPIVSYNITALSEIVTRETGKLVDISASDETYSEAIAHILENRKTIYPPENIKNVYAVKFDYEKNYTHFAKRLIELSENHES